MPLYHPFRAESSAAMIRCDIAFVFQNRKRFAHSVTAQTILCRQLILRRKLLSRPDSAGKDFFFQFLHQTVILGCSPPLVHAMLLSAVSGHSAFTGLPEEKYKKLTAVPASYSADTTGCYTDLQYLRQVYNLYVPLYKLYFSCYIKNPQPNGLTAGNPHILQQSGLQDWHLNSATIPIREPLRNFRDRTIILWTDILLFWYRS